MATEMKTATAAQAATDQVAAVKAAQALWRRNPSLVLSVRATATTPAQAAVKDATDQAAAAPGALAARAAMLTPYRGLWECGGDLTPEYDAWVIAQREKRAQALAQDKAQARKEARAKLMVKLEFQSRARRFENDPSRSTPGPLVKILGLSICGPFTVLADIYHIPSKCKAGKGKAQFFTASRGLLKMLCIRDSN